MRSHKSSDDVSGYWRSEGRRKQFLSLSLFSLFSLSLSPLPEKGKRKGEEGEKEGEEKEGGREREGEKEEGVRRRGGGKGEREREGGRKEGSEGSEI